MRTLKFAAAWCLMGLAGAAGSAPVSVTPPLCSVSDVKVTTVTRSDGTPIPPLPAPVNAAECVGAYTNNAMPIPHQGVGGNLGYYGDGLFNGEQQIVTGAQLFPNGIFSGQYTAYDLNNDGQVDPGWVYLGRWNGQSGVFSPGQFNGVSMAGSSSWFTATGMGEASGTWSFNVPVDIVSQMSTIFGDNLFDQFALSFFAGNDFAAYDITGAQFGLPTQPYPIYSFGGTWDMSRTLLNNGGNPAAISHIDLYARDPLNPQSTVPEPNSLLLSWMGLAGAVLMIRRRSQDQASAAAVPW